MRQTLTLLWFYLLCTALSAQQTDTLFYSLNARFNGGSGKYAPFLSTANQYDRYSISPNSLSAWATLHKHLSIGRTFDYGFGVELNTNVSPTQKRLFPAELYVEGKFGPFLANLGMKREYFGNQDPELSSGGLIISQNCRPLPAFTLETNGYVKVPYTAGYLEFNGGMANGWFPDNTVTKNTLMHHKWLHLRLGGSLPFTVNYGIQHVAQWSGTSPTFGHSPATMDNFVRVFFGKGGSSTSPSTEYYNSLGNHIISQNVGVSLKLKNFSAEAYWQDLSEDGPVFPFYKTYNQEDGLWGLSIRLPKFRPLHSFALEFLSTTDQSGPWHDLDGVIYGGTDSYYNNAVYPNGWSTNGMTIGNPWLTSPKYNTDGRVSIENNNLRLWYFSGMGEIGATNYCLTLANSVNYGCPGAMYSAPRNQFSGQLEFFHDLPMLKNTEASLGLSGDLGSQYGNNVALLVGIRHTGQIMKLKKH
jgi:hypothetical protein